MERWIGSGEAGSPILVDLSCSERRVVSQRLYDLAARPHGSFVIREGRADWRTGGADRCARGGERRAESRECCAARDAEPATQDSGQFQYAAITGAEAES